MLRGLFLKKAVRSIWIGMNIQMRCMIHLHLVLASSMQVQQPFHVTNAVSLPLPNVAEVIVTISQLDSLAVASAAIDICATIAIATCNSEAFM